MTKKVKPPRSWWIELGTNAKADYRNFIFDGGKNVYGTQWFGGRYSPEYWDQKRNNEFSRQDETLGVKITAVLTGGVLQAFDAFIKPVQNGIQFGYNSKGDIVEKLRKQRGKERSRTKRCCSYTLLFS